MKTQQMSTSTNQHPFDVRSKADKVTNSQFSIQHKFKIVI